MTLGLTLGHLSKSGILYVNHFVEMIFDAKFGAVYVTNLHNFLSQISIQETISYQEKTIIISQMCPRPYGVCS